MPIQVADFHFYTTTEYFEHLIELIVRTKAKDHVTIATMTLAPSEPTVSRVLLELRAAAERGVEVNLFVDARTFLMGRTVWRGEMAPGPLFFNGELPLKLRGQFKSTYHELEALQDAGGHYWITNEPGRRFTDPLSGRAHWKFAVINDQVFVGGCNLEGTIFMDVMVGWHDAAMARRLEKLAHNVAEEGSVKDAVGGDDQVYRVSNTEELLLDVGVRGQSQIMVRALQLIDEAKEFVVLGSQFFPNEVTGRHLLAAHHRGVRVQIFYNHPSRFGWPINMMLFGVVLKERRSLPRSFFKDATKKHYLHAKVLATENAALVGSHNYVNVGVKLGTAELVLSSTDAAFRRALLQTLARQVGKPILGLE